MEEARTAPQKGAPTVPVFMSCDAVRLATLGVFK